MSDDQLDGFDLSGWEQINTLDEAEKQICPSCGADAQLSWSWCRSCRSTLDKDILLSPVEDSESQQSGETPESQQSTSFISDSETWDICPSCGAEVSTGWRFCRACESSLFNISRRVSSDDGQTTIKGNPTDESNKIDTASGYRTDELLDVGPFKIVCEAVNVGDRLQEEASEHSDTGEYDHALEAYDKAQDAYENALETAKKSEFSDLIDTDKIKQRFTTVKEAQQEVNRRRLQEEIILTDREANSFERKVRV